MEYQYAELSEDETRLIQIIQTEPVVKISIVTFERAVAPRYMALSYAWGSESNTEDIVIEKEHRRMKVTPHLWSTLVDLQRVWQSSTWFWIDAISINQADDEEKSSQVLSMHLVYQQAATVVIYLGQSADGSDVAMEAFDLAKQRGRNPKRQGLKADSDRDLEQTLTHMKLYANDFFHVSAFRPIAALGRRPWFGRLWTCQEYILSQHAVLQCGEKVLEGETFNHIYSGMSIYSFGGTEPPGFGDEPELFQGFANLHGLEKRRQDRLQMVESSFFDIVMLGRDRDVTEPVDRVYALLGLAEGRDVAYRKELPVNYSGESTQQFWNLYTDFGKLALEHEKQLRLLNHASSTHRPGELPSWCPNLDAQMVTSVMDPIYAAGWPILPNEEDESNSCFPNFRGRDYSHVTMSKSTNMIQIWGTIFDEIEEIGPECDWSPDFDTDDLASIQSFAETFSAWIIECIARFSRYTANQDERAALFEDVFVGQAKPDEDTSPDRLNMLLVLLKVLTDISEFNKKGGSDAEAQKLKDRLEMFLAWIPVQYEVWARRVLIITKEGRFGWASENVQSGDHLVMLYGGPTIYILRPSSKVSSSFELVSDAFALGCMRGEVFELLRAGKTKEMQVSLV